MPAAAGEAHTTARARWLVALALALVVILGALVVIEARSGSDFRIRIFPAGERLSAEIIDGDHRILIVNATGSADARSMLGKRGRPWESRAATLIAAADERAAVGLWEAMQNLEPRQVLVVGVPADGTTWSTVEQVARDRGIELQYVSEDRLVSLDHLTVSLIPADSSPAVVVRREEVNIVFMLGLQQPQLPAQVLVAGSVAPDSTSADLVITSAGSPVARPYASLQLGPSDRVEIQFDGDRLKLVGGQYFAPGP